MVTCVHLHALIHLVFLSVFVSCKKKKKGRTNYKGHRVHFIYYLYVSTHMRVYIKNPCAQYSYRLFPPGEV